jgi:hypothetical protein
MLSALRGAKPLKSVLTFIAAMVFAWLLAAGLALLIGHTGAWIPVALVGVAAIGVTIWLLRSGN